MTCSNTTQSVKVDQHNFGNRFLLSDFKRIRCYDGRSGSIETSDSLVNNPEVYDEDDDDGAYGNQLHTDHPITEISTKDSTTKPILGQQKLSS